MALGVIISSAHVFQYDGEQEIHLTLSPDHLLTYEQIMQRRRRQDEDWVSRQQELSTKGKDYEIASPDNPLTGFGVGTIPYWNDYFLLGGRRKEGGITLTTIIGYPDSYEEMLHPLQGAMREYCEEVGFKQEGQFCQPVIESLGLFDEELDHQRFREELHPYINARYALYKEWGVVARRGRDEVRIRSSRQLPLDKVIVQDSTQDKEYAIKSFFYWDPSTSRCNILFPLQVECDGIPFSGEHKHGTKEYARDSCLVAVPPEMLTKLNIPRTELFMVYNTLSCEEELLVTIPGRFNKAIAERGLKTPFVAPHRSYAQR